MILPSSLIFLNPGLCPPAVPYHLGTVTLASVRWILLPPPRLSLPANLGFGLFYHLLQPANSSSQLPLPQKQKQTILPSMEKLHNECLALADNMETSFSQITEHAASAELYSDFNDNYPRTVFYLKLMNSDGSSFLHSFKQIYFIFFHLPNFLPPGHHLLATRRSEKRTVNYAQQQILDNHLL